MSTAKIAVVGATGRAGHHTVDALEEQGHEVVAISRSRGVDVITGEGLAQALVGVDCIVDAATGPSPEQQAATDFFVTAAENLQQAGARAGAKRIIVVSIIGCDHFPGGYGAAKVAHEQAIQSGPVPGVVLRASQFHEFVEQLVDWGRQGDVSQVPEMRTQPVAARSVGQELAKLATTSEIAAAPAPGANGYQVYELAGPREEKLVELARLLVARRGDPTRIEAVSDPDDPEHAVYRSEAMLPGPGATLAGPTFEQWLQAG
jgi:uncharacterized protein YbjT (DUF2867 family)